MINAQKTGDWDKVSKVLQGLSTRFSKEIARASQTAGEIADAAATKHLDKQDLGWAPLSAKYKKWKQKHGFSSDILTMTSTYRQSIAIYVSPDGMQVFVGVKRGVNREIKPTLSVKSQTRRLKGYSDSTREKSFYKNRRANKAKKAALQKAKKSDVVAIGYVHEYGSRSRKIPSRPLWRPTAIETRPAVMKVYQDALKRTLQQ